MRNDFLPCFACWMFHKDDVAAEICNPFGVDESVVTFASLGVTPWCLVHHCFACSGHQPVRDD